MQNSEGRDKMWKIQREVLEKCRTMLKIGHWSNWFQEESTLSEEEKLCRENTRTDKNTARISFAAKWLLISKLTEMSNLAQFKFIVLAFWRSVTPKQALHCCTQAVWRPACFLSLQGGICSLFPALRGYPPSWAHGSSPAFTPATKHPQIVLDSDIDSPVSIFHWERTWD
jgi:hypothetical protein